MTDEPRPKLVKSYQYVGPAGIKARASGAPAGVRIDSVADLEGWFRAAGQRPAATGFVAATFVIDDQGFLRVADRRSEHVACSGGGPVLSAGEVFFRLGRERVEVAEVSNQSTGFCPEPASWPAVAEALDRFGMAHPGRFTQEIAFRRCPACGERNIVKGRWFACGSCGTELPAGWNFGDPT